MEHFADISPFWAGLMIAVLIFVLLWPLSVRLRDASLVDLLWAPGFLLHAGLAYVVAPSPGAHALAVLSLLVVWAVRLGLVLSRRRFQGHGEDPRYVLVRKAWGQSFWWKSLFVVFVLQAIVQWIIAVGAGLTILAPAAPAGILLPVGICLALAGLCLETMADWQLDRFKRDAPAGALCDTGLRAWIRHPNYLGEIVFWTGLGLIGADLGIWVALCSGVLLMGLLVKVSGVPLMEEHLAASRPGFAAYRARVPALWPRFGRAQ